MRRQGRVAALQHAASHALPSMGIDVARRAGTRDEHVRARAERILGVLLAKSRHLAGPVDVTVDVCESTIIAVHMASDEAPIGRAEWESAAREGLPMGPFPEPLGPSRICLRSVRP